MDGHWPKHYPNALAKDTRMCFDTRAVKRGGPDPQDSLLYLEQLMGVIETGVQDDSHSVHDRKRAYHLQLQSAPSNAYQTEIFQEYVNEDWVDSERQAFLSRVMPSQIAPHDSPCQDGTGAMMEAHFAGSLPLREVARRSAGFMPKVTNAGMATCVSSCTVVPPRGVCLTRILGLKGTLCPFTLSEVGSRRSSMVVLWKGVRALLKVVAGTRISVVPSALNVTGKV